MNPKNPNDKQIRQVLNELTKEYKNKIAQKQKIIQAENKLNQIQQKIENLESKYKSLTDISIITTDKADKSIDDENL